MTRGLAVEALLLMGIAGGPQHAQKAEQPVESAHQHGPNGWEGWTLNYTIPDHPGERFPMTLVLARHGHIVHRIADGPFVWRWMFWSGGRQVAYETGPLHFSMECVLFDVTTGKRVADYDCYRELPADAPDWVKRVENLR